MDSFYRNYLAEKIHPIPDDALDRALGSFEGAALKFSSDFISDAKQRENYNSNVKRVKATVLEQVKSGKVSVKEAAEFCYEARNKIMAEIRAKTSAHGLAIAEGRKKISKPLEQLLNEKSLRLHGEEFLKLGAEQKNSVYYELIESSARPDARFNTMNKVLKVTGKVMIVVTIAYAAYEISNAENKAKESVEQGTAIAGGIAGAALASMAVSLVCGPGAPVCTIALLLAGSVAGGMAASATTEYFDDELEEYTKWAVN
ncbi:hypothetical protein ACA097_26795 [Pseudomonas sp. QL9]|uniref:hypothetical protein n=1 Tax=Pseudomonas sp. QL9 TaxID=3242725 RepID=UPI00352B1592